MVFCAAHLLNLNLVESRNVENKNIENYKCRNIILKYSAAFCLNRKDSCPVLLVNALEKQITVHSKNRFDLKMVHVKIKIRKKLESIIKQFIFISFS